MTVLAFIQWCNDTAVGTAVRDSTWLFPVVETFHLLGLGVLGGAVLLVDLRLFGLGLSSRPVPELASEVRPWMLGGLAVMLVSGVVLFLSEPLKCYENAAFWLKMASLALAIVFTFTIRRRVTAADPGRVPALPQRAVAFVSFVLWSGVGITGRGIAFW